jgi:hypothetical protein
MAHKCIGGQKMDMPSEILDLIVEYLPIRSLLTFRLVSRKYREKCNKKVVKVLRASFHPDIAALFPYVAIMGLSLVDKIVPKGERPAKGVDPFLVNVYDNFLPKQERRILNLSTPLGNRGRIIEHLTRHKWLYEGESFERLNTRSTISCLFFVHRKGIWGYTDIYIHIRPTFYVPVSFSFKLSWFNGSVLYVPHSAELLNLDHNQFGPMARLNTDWVIEGEADKLLKSGFAIRTHSKRDQDWLLPDIKYFRL